MSRFANMCGASILPDHTDQYARAHASTRTPTRTHIHTHAHRHWDKFFEVFDQKFKQTAQVALFLCVCVNVPKSSHKP